jgi:hypothetical protein
VLGEARCDRPLATTDVASVPEEASTPSTPDVACDTSHV